MPGLVGFTLSDALRDNAKLTLVAMRELTLHREFYQVDDCFIDEKIAGTRVHTSILQPEAQPYHHNNIYVWLDGEFYDRDKLISQIDYPVKTDPEILLAFYQKDPSFRLLGQIDGIFAAVIYDASQQKVYLISDRRGLRYLYWTQSQDSLVWCSELKSLLGLPGYQIKIDKAAVEDFLGLRYKIGDRSWFDGVEILPAATVLTWDITTATLEKNRYWWWTQIHPLDSTYNENELVEEIGHRFIAAVEKRSQPLERVGLSLSGGLDSRAILAAMPDQGQIIHAVGLGQPDCDDIILAQQVAKIKKAVFHPLEMNASNWLDSLTNYLWETDAYCSIIHAQIVPALQYIKQHNLYDFKLNGVPGGAHLGGTHLFELDRLDYFVNIRLGLNNFAYSDNHQQAVLQRFKDYFKALGESTYILIMDNRVRSFTLKDAQLSMIDGIQTRFPFIDNELDELLYNIPPQILRENKLYEKMLLQRFPQYYKTIPWQSTGVPIGLPSLSRRIQATRIKAQKKLARGINKVGFKIDVAGIGKSPPVSDFTDYADWLRQSPGREFYESILFAPDVLYAEYVSPDNVKEVWESHQQSKQNQADKISLILTLEIWLQQVFNGKYR